MKLLKFLTLLLISSHVISCAQVPSKSNTEVALNDTGLINKPDSFWKNRLDNEEYYILREKGTEKPYTGKWLLNKDSGYYTCAACGNQLFRSDQKFDSHCGWPSFDEEIEGGKIITKKDLSHGMDRTEIMCGRCGGHLGHLFDDGPTETGKRYCVNSISLDFIPANEFKEDILLDTLTLGGGCFWCIEAVYELVDGVVSVQSGYSGGYTAYPTYRQVCTGETNHAEVVQIVFDTKKVTLTELLEIFFTVHDPTTKDMQGADVGTQYRSIIFFKDSAQKAVALNVINSLEKAKVYDSPIVTEVKPFTKFYVAEISHQDYYETNKSKPYCRMVIQPKIEKFEKVFKDLKK